MQQLVRDEGGVIIPMYANYVFARSSKVAREEGGEIVITVMSFWRSLESLDAFAGTDRSAAVVSPGVTAFLSSYDKRVQHFDLAFADTPFDLTYG